MRGRQSQLVVILTPEARHRLQYHLRCTTTPLGLARRCQAILAVADGLLAVVKQSGFSRTSGDDTPILSCPALAGLLGHAA